VGHPWDRGPNQELAMNSSFETFAIKSSYHGGPGRSIESYVHFESRIPDNLRLLRFENLAEQVCGLFASIGLSLPGDFPWVNRSRHDDHRLYYTPAAEQAVYNRYRWVFDNGPYERMAAEDLAGPRAPGALGLPLAGPVVQAGLATGYWRDGWVGGRFRFRVSSTGSIATMTIQGQAPAALGETIRLRLHVGGDDAQAEFATAGPFEWRLPVQAATGDCLDIELESEPTWCPASGETSDDRRRLAFQLRRIGFESVPEPLVPVEVGARTGGAEPRAYGCSRHAPCAVLPHQTRGQLHSQLHRWPNGSSSPHRSPNAPATGDTPGPCCSTCSASGGWGSTCCSSTAWSRRCASIRTALAAGSSNPRTWAGSST
jgi:hypothetical protein